MPITLATITDRETVRADLVRELLRRKADNPAYRVIDVGGRHNPWADEAVDAYADIYKFETDKELYVGDIHDDDFWRRLAAGGHFDFAIISHVLEDVRYPITALKWLPRIARSGMLGVPSRHTEFSNGISKYWLGQFHHAWIFTVQMRDGSPVLQAIPKMPCVEYFNRARPAPPGDEAPYGPRDLPWLRPELAGRDQEFVVRWETDLPFEMPEYHLDEAGQIAFYRERLSSAVEDPAPGGP